MILRNTPLILGFIFAVSALSPVAFAETESASKANVKHIAQSGSQASLAKKRKDAGKKTKADSELQTDVKFDDSVLHGQYQTPDEALAKVENEKGLSDLLGVRKHFKDRLTTASEQE